MTLYDMMNAMSIQGNVEIRIVDANGLAKETHFFRDVDELSSTCYDVDEFEDMEVLYIYPTKSLDSEPWLVIELE